MQNSPMHISKMHLHVEQFALKINRKLAEKHLCNQERCTQDRVWGEEKPLSGGPVLLGGYQSVSVQSLSHVWLFVTPWIAAGQASLSITNSRSLLKLMSIESVMPSSHLILCCPLFLLPPISPSIRVFSKESTLHVRRPKYWSFSFSISPSSEYPGLISFRVEWLDLLAV